MSDTRRFMLVPGSWYAWYMFPGHATAFLPFVSPIKVYDVEPEKTGRSTLLLRFYAAGYADGVRDFDLRMRILTRRNCHLLVELLYDAGDDGGTRDAVIGCISPTWIAAHVPSVDGLPRPGPEASRAEINSYLDRADRNLNAW